MGEVYRLKQRELTLQTVAINDSPHLARNTESVAKFIDERHGSVTPWEYRYGDRAGRRGR